jgi:hypothetical protein
MLKRFLSRRFLLLSLVPFSLGIGVEGTIAKDVIMQFGRPVPAPYPSNNEFAQVQEKVATVLSSKDATTGIQLTDEEREKREKFQRGWAKANPTIARFVGTWHAGDRTYYIYPSKVSRRVCIASVKGNDRIYGMGVVSGASKEIRVGEGSFFWIDNKDALAARDTGTGELYPIFATIGTINLPPEAVQFFDKVQCNKSLPS